MTLYYFTKDSPGKSTPTGVVLSNWPPFYTAQITTPAPLRDVDFGTITRDDGVLVTTYKGWALYHYAGDKSPGDTFGQGINGIWFVVNPDNFLPRETGPNSTGSPASPPPPTTPISGY